MRFEILNKAVVASGLIFILGASCTLASRHVQRLSNGAWGGQHIQFQVSDGSVDIEYDCAHGAIRGPLTFDSEGRFSWHGTYTREHGGPVRLRDKVNDLPATYSGSIKGDTMTLTVRLEDSSLELQKFILTRGDVGRVWKCK